MAWDTAGQPYPNPRPRGYITPMAQPYGAPPKATAAPPASPIKPGPEWFDPKAYLARNPDVAANQKYRADPYQHYLDYGKSEGRAYTEKTVGAKDAYEKKVKKDAVAANVSAPNYLRGGLNGVGAREGSYSPTYQGVALQTADLNQQAARDALQANRVSQSNPYGSTSWTQDKVLNADGTVNPNAGWRQTTTLTPQNQKVLDANNANRMATSGLMGLTQSRLNNTIAKAPDYSSVNDVRDSAYKAMTSRLDPQWDRSDDALRNRLANQGLQAGSQAYNDAMQTQAQGKNDAYQQANLGAISTMPQTLQMSQDIRNQGFDELTRERNLSQVESPQFQGYSTQGTTPGANMSGAYDAQNAMAYQNETNKANRATNNRNNVMGGLVALGSSALDYYGRTQ